MSITWWTSVSPDLRFVAIRCHLVFIVSLSLRMWVSEWLFEISFLVREYCVSIGSEATTPVNSATKSIAGEMMNRKYFSHPMGMKAKLLNSMSHEFCNMCNSFCLPAISNGKDIKSRLQYSLREGAVRFSFVLSLSRWKVLNQHLKNLYRKDQLHSHCTQIQGYTILYSIGTKVHNHCSQIMTKSIRQYNSSYLFNRSSIIMFILSLIYIIF